MPDIGPDIQPRKWPVVVGIISICLSSLFLVCTVVGVGMLAIMPRMMKDQGPLPPTMTVSTPMLVQAVLGVVDLVILLVAGIMTVRRNPSGRTTHLVYAVLALPLVALGTWVQWQNGAAMEQWVRENPGSPFAKGYSPTGQTIGLLFGVLMGAAWPVFCLIWFGAVKRTAESFGPRPAPPPI